MTTSSIIWLLLLWVVVSHAQACEVSGNLSSFKWDKLEAVAKEIPFFYGLVRPKEVNVHRLWNCYKSSTGLKKLKYVNEMSQFLNELAFRSTQIYMIGLILFGPEKGRSILRRLPDRDDYRKLHEGDEYFQCRRNMNDLLRKHCGLQISDGMMWHARSFSNICHYVEEMVMIEDAIITTCGSNNVAPSVIDVGNPRIVVAPAPIRGSSIYCGRGYVNGVSRLKLQSYAKAYKVTFDPLPSTLHSKIQICFHRNASSGLCQCEHGEWRYIQNLYPRQYLTSPYEQRFVDVKFTSAAHGSVTITLDEVPLLQLSQHALLAIGVFCLFISGSKDLLSELADSHDVRVLNRTKWIVHVLGVSFILRSSLDTPLAMVAAAVATPLAMVVAVAAYYAISSIIAPTDPWVKLRKSWIRVASVDDVAEWGASAHEFRDWVINNPSRILCLNYSYSRVIEVDSDSN